MAREKRLTKLRRFIEERLVIEPEKTVRIGVWLLGTVVCHNLNLAGTIKWFGNLDERVPTGLPGPFAYRRKFFWEKKAEPTWEDKICEWGLPAVMSWILIYHPEAVAQFVDAMVPF